MQDANESSVIPEALYTCQQDLEQTFSRLIANGRWPQVALLCGRKGLGKDRIAAALVKQLLCLESNEKGSCGVCVHCLDIGNGRHDEVCWITTEDQKFKVSDAEVAQEHLNLRPASGSRWRIVVLPDIDQMLPAAANRLLKILEEPPEQARIICTTSRPGAVLDTILSRMVKFQVAPVNRQEIFSWLIEKQGVDPGPNVDRAIVESGFTPYGALELLQNDSFSIESPRTWQEASQLGEKLHRDKGVGPMDLLEWFEKQLNLQYRQGLKGEGPVKMNARRQFLRNATRVAFRGRVALNKQLLLERFFLNR